MGERRKIKEPLDVVAARRYDSGATVSANAPKKKSKKGYYTVGLQERKRRGESAFVIQFYLNGKRKSLFLGAKYSRSFAEEICRVVEKVVVALTTGSNVDRRTYAWLESMEVDLRERFESAGLLEPEIRLTLGELFDAYFRAEDSAMRPITFRNKTRSAAIFFELFERSRDVSTFAKSDALRLIAALDRKYAEATRAGVVRDVSRVFSWAVETELLDASPFKGVKRGSFKNKSRETFVGSSLNQNCFFTQERAQRVVSGQPLLIQRQCLV